jgi:hypothetical protein
MFSQSQFVLLVALIILALVLLNWETRNSMTAPDDLPEESGYTKPKLASKDPNRSSS